MIDQVIFDEIKDELFLQQDTVYRDFQAKLIPTIDKETVIGVRTPALRKMAKQLAKREDIDTFLKTLPHKYFEENQLHAFIIAERKDFTQCMGELCAFLPYVDNWATCDQMSPKVFKKHRQELLPYIREWIASDQTYTVRFGVGMLMAHFLDEDFDRTYPEMISKIRSEEYYVNMMFACILPRRWRSNMRRFCLISRKRDWRPGRTIRRSRRRWRAIGLRRNRRGI